MWKNIFCLFSSSYQFPCNDMSDPINFEFEKKRFKYGAPRVISQSHSVTVSRGSDRKETSVALSVL